MIDSVSKTVTAASAADSNPKPASGKQLCHTPFGDVMVDELSTTDLKGLFSTKTPDSSASTPAATLPPATAVVSATPSAPATANPLAAPGTPAPQPDPHSIPTAQSVFGEHVWLDAPTGAGPSNTHWNYNPIYFATPETAEKIATMVGGKVVEENSLAPNGPMRQQQPNQMIELPDGHRVNAGLIADFFNHGYPQYYTDLMVQAEIRGSQS